MLILTRNAGQSLRIGDDIVLRVLRIQEGQVRLGIEAPRDIEIERDNAKRDKAGNLRREIDGNR